MEEEKLTTQTVTVQIEDIKQTFYDKYMERIYRVYDIFKEFFSEENVDLQNIYSYSTLMNELDLTAVKDVIYRNSCAEELYKKWLDIHNTLFKYLSISTQIEILQILIHDSERDSPFYNKVLAQYPFILVHFPHVRITNEHNKYTDIYHLYAKVFLSCVGKMKGNFSLCKTEYTLLHFFNNYMHSHTPRIVKHQISKFLEPCLGEGPIKDTESALKYRFNDNLWSLFCLELSKYVTVESLEGIPYYSLERLHLSNEYLEQAYDIWVRSINISVIPIEYMKEFILYVLQSNKLIYGFANGAYTIGMTYINYMITISNLFIKWYNEVLLKKEPQFNVQDLFDNEFLLHCVISDGKIYKEDNSISLESLKQYIGTDMFVFKGKMLKLNITNLEEYNNDYKYILLHPSIVSHLLYNILRILNYKKSINNEKQTNTIPEILSAFNNTDRETETLYF